MAKLRSSTVARGSARTGLTFFNTLLDENATCHIAYVVGLVESLSGASDWAPEKRVSHGINHSSVRTDFTIGGTEVEVDAVTMSGDVLPFIRHERWLLTDL